MFGDVGGGGVKTYLTVVFSKPKEGETLAARLKTREKGLPQDSIIGVIISMKI